jgi:ABC-type polysaccharide/polyol phosphate export permease
MLPAQRIGKKFVTASPAGRQAGHAMFRTRQQRGTMGKALEMLELIYHSTVREVRKKHGNAILGLALNIVQSVIFIAGLYGMFILFGMRGSGIRGDFMLYVMSGIFMFMSHTKAMGAVVAAEGSTSAMMNHAPLNSVVTITAAAIAALYLQMLSLFAILFTYHTLVNPVVIDQPMRALGMLIISWGSGVGVGIIFLSLKAWSPDFTRVGSQIYARVNMIASGKMFVANTMPGYMLAMFDWNPLFHCIDQSRGFIFLNYTPRFTSVSYPIYVTLGLIVVGMMIEFYTRNRASISWNAGR